MPGNDSLEFIWSTWWFKHALLDLRASPLQISVLNYPDGIYFPLLPAMSQSFLLALPVAAITSPVIAFNIVYFLSFPLCGLAGYWLCAELTGDQRAAFIGGLIWAFFPNKMGHALTGHLFQLVVFTLPLAALFLLRVLRQPSARHAVLAGIALAIAATIHPVNVAYFLLPLLIVVIGGRWIETKTLPWRELALTALTGGALSAPLFLPTVLNREQLGSLVERGAVGFSTDLLAFIIPAPGSPLIAGTPLAELSARVAPFPFETIAYLGIVPIILALFALLWRWRESRLWLWLGLIAAVLALGPVLQIGREIVRMPVEVDRFPVLMPYAFLGRLPFFQWSRTPGRLNETVMFAMAILASLGMAAALARIKKPIIGWAIWIAASVIIPFEFIVQWPMPTSPVPVSPALSQLADDDSFKAVMNFPVPENTINLYSLIQQTYHQHPMIGGRVYRDQLGSGASLDFLSRTITATILADDIAPGPTVEQRVAALQYFGVGRIIYQPEGDKDGSARAAVESLLGAPVSSDSILSIYKVPSINASALDPFSVFGSNWYAPEIWQEPTRWFRGIATVYAFGDQERRGAIAFTAIPTRNARRLIIKVNGAEVAYFGVGDWAEYRTPEVSLHRGLNYVEFFDEDGSWQYVGDPRCQAGSPVAGPFPVAVPCDAAANDARDLSLAIQNLRLIPQAEPYSAIASFADSLELLTATAPTQAKPGDLLTAHFFWRASGHLDKDYTMFLHLLDVNGQLVAGSDGYPAHGQYPTTQWRPGEIVAYNAAVQIPPAAPRGSYSVEIGWYQWPSLERLKRSDGSTSLTISKVEVRR